MFWIIRRINSEATKNIFQRISAIEKNLNIQMHELSEGWLQSEFLKKVSKEFWNENIHKQIRMDTHKVATWMWWGAWSGQL